MKKSELLNVDMGEDINHASININRESKIKLAEIQRNILLKKITWRVSGI